MKDYAYHLFVAFDQLVNAVQAGQRSIPTEAELIAEMEALK